jgi:uncharacterized protein (TIRG00374 family)
MIRKIISVLTLVIVAVIVWMAREQLVEAVGYMGKMNVWVLLFLIPEQLYMYYAAGQMYFSFMRAKGVKMSRWKLMRISFEINFMNHIVPSGGVSGLGYLAWRLKEFRISAGQATFMHVLRYGIAAVTTTAQMWVAIIILAVAGLLPGWVGGLGVVTCLGIEVVVVVAFLIIMSKRRIDWFAGVASRVVNGVVRWVSLGRKRKVLKERVVDKYFSDLHGDWLVVKKDRGVLVRPYLWGVVYSFLEAASYWVVACALGAPEVLPQIMLGQGMASIVGTVVATPGGVGGYEGAMILVLISTGVEWEVATIVVIVTRVILLMGTILSGWGFYQQALLARKRKEG